MAQFSLAKLFGVTIRESATDGSDFTNPDADYRRLYLGEDGQLHVKDSAGTVTDIGVAGTVATDAIWDATGDLAVGSGANTAAKLTIGAAGTLPIVSGGTLAYAKAPTLHGCRITEATAQSVNDDTLTALTCNDADIFDTDAYHDTVTNNTRLTIPTGFGGYYKIGAYVQFASDTTTGTRDVAIRVDGTTYISYHRTPNVTTGIAHYLTTETLYSLAQAQYVECMVSHVSGNAINVTLNAFYLYLVGV